MSHIVGIGKKLDAPFWQCRRPITLKGAQNQHELIFGGSGSGKSNALHFRARQDVKLKRGFIAIDTHGDLFDGLLDDLIYYGWAPEDVVILNPTDQRWGSPGLNLLECPTPEQHPYEIIAEVVDAFSRSLFSESTGPRMQDLLRRCFMGLQEQNLTISEAEEFLTNSSFRNAVIETLKNQEVKHFWTTLDSLRASDLRLISEAPRNKLSALLSHPALYNILAQSHSTISFRDIMDTGKCCLINLSRNHLKLEARTLFASLILARIVLAILSREEIPRQQRVFCTLFLDEAAEYFHSPDSFLTISTGARKFNVGMKLCSQSPFQFKEHADIFLTNANLVCFNVDYKSGERLVPDLFPLTGQRVKFQSANGHPTYYSLAEERSHFLNELMNQRPGEYVIKMRGADHSSPYITTVPLITPSAVDPEAKHAFCAASAKIYYRSSEQIEEDRRRRLARWLTPSPITLTNR